MSMRVLNLILAGALLGLGGCSVPGGSASPSTPSTPSTNAGVNCGATGQSGDDTKGCEGCAKKDTAKSGSS